MKHLLILCLAIQFLSQPLLAADPEQGYLFAYASEKNAGRNGLHFAWSLDRVRWHPIGPEFGFVRSDYGRWGSQKRMIKPFLYKGTEGLWHCVWALNEEEGVFAHVSSPDLVYWQRQAYPQVSIDKNCLMPDIAFDKAAGTYIITWESKTERKTETYSTTTKDFKNFTDAKPTSATNRINGRETIEISGNVETGTIHQVPWSVIDGLIKAQQLSKYKQILYSENAKTDAERFASLKPVEATLIVNASNPKRISDLLLGVFFEDINYAADGGLYAELVQNRDFEYSLADKEGRDSTWNSYKAWKLNGKQATFAIDSASPIHPNNKHFAVLDIKQPGAGIVNEGFDGIALKAGEKYDFSVFARDLNGNKGKLTVRLISKNGEILGETSSKAISPEWKKYDMVLTANKTVADAQLEIVSQTAGKIALDMISLFPQRTFKGRKNGLRADLAQTIADMHPRFVRFPGGCVAHGDGLQNMYRWQNTIGPLEARKPQRNLWNYHQTAGLGYYEYFQFCEDIGAEPLPVVPAAVPCQNSATGGGGQQGGIPMEEMDEYVQEVLNLIEWANGDVKTKWGKKRAEAGHPKPFNLKYLGVGNEDLITDVFEERFAIIYKAVKEKYPEITVIGTVGPFYEGTDYLEGWNLASKLNIPMVDEHYYVSPGWFIHNQDFYDKYDRSKSKVYLGEYAAHLPGRPNNVETALAEALHLTTLERNGDVVTMASYAPMLAKEGHTQWNPDLIYFNNTEVKPTVGYHVQKLFGQHAGDEYLESKIMLLENRDDVKKRVAVSVVRDTKSQDLIVKLVNLLPVEVQMNIDLSGFQVTKTEAVKTVLQGSPDDKNAKPATSSISVSEKFPCGLPAYSFTVVRIPAKK